MLKQLIDVLNWMRGHDVKMVRVKLNIERGCWGIFHNSSPSMGRMNYDLDIKEILLKDVQLVVVKTEEALGCAPSEYVGYAEGKPVVPEQWTPDVSLAKPLTYRPSTHEFLMEKDHTMRTVQHVKYLWLQSDNKAVAIE